MSAAAARPLPAAERAIATTANHRSILRYPSGIPGRWNTPVAGTVTTTISVPPELPASAARVRLLLVQTWEAIRSRRDVREFTDEPIADDHLDEILESGRRAPSSQ